MPVCKKCNKSFSNRAVIEGKQKNLSKRKFCLECSPWGLHNTRQLDIVDKETEEIRVCTLCNKQFVFRHDRTRRNGSTLTKCASCMVNAGRTKQKEKMVEYKGGSCQRCGYNRNIKNLCFHHLDSTKKDFTISGAHCRKWEVMIKELDKCIMLCSNCHVEVHDEEQRSARQEK